MENKTTKYFKYAIGEIILVFIGVLIALQINNWNELINSLQYFYGALLLGEAVSLKKREKANEFITLISATYQINKHKLSID